MNQLLAWARGNPIWARLWIKIGIRMPLALGLVVGMQALADRFDLSANGAAIVAVLVAIWGGGRIAERVFTVAGIPEPPPQ